MIQDQDGAKRSQASSCTTLPNQPLQKKMAGTVSTRGSLKNEPAAAMRLCTFLITTTILNLFVTFVPTANGMQIQPPPLSSEIAKTRLVQQALRVRHQLNLALRPADLLVSLPLSKKELYFASSYEQDYGPRGFCNWLIPGSIMIGQYPGETPEDHGPTQLEATCHINRVVRSAGVRLFVSLQGEVPDQDDYRAWEEAQGKVRLPAGNGREEFPEYFSHYAPLVRDALINNDDADLGGYRDDTKTKALFAHSPILDLSTPDSSSLVSLLSFILEFMENSSSNDDAIYVHCWGGRGRAGTIGSCLLSLLFPELDAKACLQWVQNGYDSRDGAQFMPSGLRKSPQTASQRRFVEEFANSLKV